MILCLQVKHRSGSVANAYSVLLQVPPSCMDLECSALLSWQILVLHVLYAVIITHNVPVLFWTVSIKQWHGKMPELIGRRRSITRRYKVSPAVSVSVLPRPNCCRVQSNQLLRARVFHPFCYTTFQLSVGIIRRWSCEQVYYYLSTQSILSRGPRSHMKGWFGLLLSRNVSPPEGQDKTRIGI